MKSHEELEKEAQSVLESLGNMIKRQSDSAFSADEINAIASVADSYARLYEEIQK